MARGEKQDLQGKISFDDSPARGKKYNQKIKPYDVLQFLLKNTDEDHLVDAFDIIAFLEDCGIEAERRSMWRIPGCRYSR